MFGKWHVTEAMIRYGGGFVSGLGKLYRQADVENKKRMREAFPRYFLEYGEIARLKEAELEEGK